MSNVNLNPTSYTDFLTGLPLPWLNGNPVGNGNAAVLGYMFDYFTNQVLQGIQMRFPDYAPKDALRYLGNERGLIQGVSETDDAFRERLRLAWVYWALAGTPIGILFELYNQGYTDGYIVQVNGPIFSISGTPNIEKPVDSLLEQLAGGNPSIYGDPPWWSFDLDNSFTSRFALLFPTPPAQWTDILYTDPLYGIGVADGYTTDSSSPSTSDITIIENIISKWKPAKATFVGIFVATQGEMIGFPVDTIAERNTRNGGEIGSPASIVVKF